MDLVEFLKARLDEDERIAKRVAPNQAPNELRAMVMRGDAQAELIVDSARVLREVEAKRRIVDLADEASGLDMQVDLERLVGSRDTSEEPYLGDEILRALALAYSDHPDYREEWRP